MKWSIYSYGTTFLLQGLYFILLARLLGPSEFGRFSAGLALVAILATFVGLGGGNLLVMRTAQKPQLFSEQFGIGLLYIAVSSVVFGILLGLVPMIVHLSFAGTLLPLALSEFLFAKVNQYLGQAFQARDMLHASAHINVGAAAVRLMSISLFAVVPTVERSANRWAWYYLAVSIVVACVSYGVAAGVLGSPRLNRRALRKDWKVGIFFSLGQASKTVYADIDKVMLAQLVSVGVAGVYTSAYRLEAMSFVPLQAVVFANNVSFYRAADQGPQQLVRAMRALRRPIMIFGVIAACGLAIAALLGPSVLGSGYTEVRPMALSLVALPLLQGFHYLTSDGLMATGRQALRSVLQLSTAALNVVLNLVLIPIWSWGGAVVATYVSEGALLILALITIRAVGRGARATPRHAAASTSRSV